MKVAHHSIFIHPIPAHHRFPMEKYDLLPKQLNYEGIVTENDYILPGIIDRKTVEKIHDSEYLDRFLNLELSPKEQRVTGFIHNKELVERELRIVEATRRCVEYAVSTRSIGLNIAGGTHHAFSNKGEGFCMLNDNAVAAKWLIDEGLCERILIVDLDVHQGNGTAEIFKNNDAVFTFSMHGKNNYPLHKEQSDLDVELEDGVEDGEYLYKLEQSLDTILSNFTPDFVFFQSGVDVLATDKLGKLALTQRGCYLRDELVFKTVRELNIPMTCSMGGGYSKDIKDIVNAHTQTFRLAQYYFG